MQQSPLAQVLYGLFQKEFGNTAFAVGQDPLIVFPAAHPAVGDLRIYEAGKEGRVEIGNLTHGHFYSFGSYETREQAVQELAENIFDFVVDLVGERVILWHTTNGKFGGWFYRDDANNEMAPHGTDSARMYLWSGPLEP